MNKLESLGLQSIHVNSKSKLNVSLVVPVYNSEATIEKLYSSLADQLQRQSQEYEIIFINDGSRDGSWDKLSSIARACENVRAVNLMKNFGQHNALLCGLRKAKYDVIVTMDDDLQNPVEEIPRLLAQLESGADVVYGVPELLEHGAFRRWCSKLTKLILAHALGAGSAREISSFRAFKRSVCIAFDQFSGPQVNLDVLLAWGANRFDSVTVKHRSRSVGHSNYNFLKLVSHALNMLTGFSVLPLKISSFIGTVGVLLGLILLAYVFGRFLLQGCPVPGFPFLASVIILFSGAQLLALGIIGEYLARMYMRTMDQPCFVVKEEIGSSP